eukprot:scaffold52332_cov47-Attheya_sp.AAC.2
MIPVHYIVRQCICDLSADESTLELLRYNGHETDARKNMRQFLILVDIGTVEIQWTRDGR